MIVNNTNPEKALWFHAKVQLLVAKQLGVIIYYCWFDDCYRLMIRRRISATYDVQLSICSIGLCCLVSLLEAVGCSYLVLPPSQRRKLMDLKYEY